MSIYQSGPQSAPSRIQILTTTSHLRPKGAMPGDGVGDIEKVSEALREAGFTLSKGAVDKWFKTVSVTGDGDFALEVSFTTGHPTYDAFPRDTGETVQVAWFGSAYSPLDREAAVGDPQTHRRLLESELGEIFDLNFRDDFGRMVEYSYR